MLFKKWFYLALKLYFSYVLLSSISFTKSRKAISKKFLILKEGALKLLNELKSGKAPGPDGITKAHLTIDTAVIGEMLALNLRSTT